MCCGWCSGRYRRRRHTSFFVSSIVSCRTSFFAIRADKVCPGAEVKSSGTSTILSAGYHGGRWRWRQSLCVQPSKMVVVCLLSPTIEQNACSDNQRGQSCRMSEIFKYGNLGYKLTHSSYDNSYISTAIGATAAIVCTNLFSVFGRNTRRLSRRAGDQRCVRY